MSVKPPTDLVLEVERAADPARAAAVTARLNALSRAGGAGAANFETALRDASPAPVARSAPAARTPTSHAGKAETKLESLVLTEFLSEMLPKDAESAYGKGFAGEMWRSLLAERVADQLAASGRLGVAAHLFGKAAAPAPTTGEAAFSVNRVDGA